MPTYQYACTDCGHRFEAVQAFTDNSLTTCPECQGRLRKVFGSVGVVFKGSGFYRNDSRAGGSDGAAKDRGDKAGEKTGDKGGEKTAEKTADAPKADKAGEKTGAKRDAAASSDSKGSGAKTSGDGARPSSPSTSSSPARTPA